MAQVQENIKVFCTSVYCLVFDKKNTRVNCFGLSSFHPSTPTTGDNNNTIMQYLFTFHS